MTAFFEWSKKAVGYRNPHPHFYEIKISRTAPSPIGIQSEAPERSEDD